VITVSILNLLIVLLLDGCCDELCLEFQGELVIRKMKRLAQKRWKSKIQEKARLFGCEMAPVQNGFLNASREVDLRSDTVTKPTAEMRTAMANAEVDDDVLGADPTVSKLQQQMTKIFGN
jgi:hypothetical protein